jgi:hypothetical protein
MTYRYVVYDLQKSFNASFDDADFTFNQILYWVMVTANRKSSTNMLLIQIYLHQHLVVDVSD